MKNLSNFLMPLCILFASVCGAQEINQVNCDGSTLVDFSTATVPDFNLDEDHPFTGPTVFFEMEPTNMFTEFYTSGAGGLNLIDTQLWVFQKEGFGWELREFNDNSVNAPLGFSYTFQKFSLGQELLIAVGSNNANGGTCYLNTTSCKPVQDFDLSIPSRGMILGQTYQPEGSVGIGLLNVPGSTSVTPYNFDLFTFSGTGGEMTLTLDPVQTVSSTFEYAVVQYVNGAWEVIANDVFFPDTPFDVLFETEFATTYHLIIQSNGYNAASEFDGIGTYAEEGIAVTLSDEFNSASDLGSFFNPWQLNEGDYIQSSLTHSPVGSPDEIGCWPDRSVEHYYQLDGNGSTQRLVFSGGTVTLGTNNGSGGPFDIVTPTISQTTFRFSVFTMNNLDEVTCLFDENDVFLESELLLPTSIGETYFVRVSSYSFDEYSIYLGSEEEQMVNYFESNAKRIFCGEDSSISAVTDEEDDQVKNLFSSCGTTLAHPQLNVLKYLADGDVVSLLIPPTDGLSGEIRIMVRTGNSFTCTSGPHLLLGDGSFNLAMPTNDQVEYFIVADLVANEDPSTLFQLISQNCVPCPGSYSGLAYPADIDNTFVQQVIGEIPGCCTIGWAPTCQDNFNERVMDAQCERAIPLNCGVHDLTFAMDELSRAIGPYSIDGINLGSGDAVYAFVSTGDEMTVSWQEWGLPSKVTVFTNDGDYQTYGQINSELPVTFTAPQGTQMYVLVAGMILEGVISSTSGVLTITDANQCGLCDVVYNNEVNLPPYDLTFDAVVNLNSSCCSSWSESCQNLYNVFSFPTCFTAIEASCGDIFSGDTTGDPFYQEYRCNEEEFTSPANWFTFTGDGKTWVVEAINDVSANLNTQLHAYTGECPLLTCEVSDSDSGEFDDAKLSVPTVEGESYFIAVTGENGDEGAYTLEFRTSDYCGTCYTEYSNQHGYDVSNQIYQSVIAENPSCCSSFWDSGCDQLYNSYICAFAAEPNNSLFDAAYMGSFGEDNCSVIQQASVDKQSDSDFYQISINQSGSLSIDLNSLALQPDLNIRLIHNDLEVGISNNEFSSFEFIEHEVNVPGTYYIEVYAAENASFSMNECYDLTVNWQAEVITCTLNVELEDEGDCNPEDGSWEFDIEITSNNVGGSTWLINGEEYPISDQIEVFTLSNFTPNGELQNLQVRVKENPACQVFLPNFVISPQPCFTAVSTCPFDTNNDNEINATDLLAFLGAFGTQCSE